MQPSFFCTCLCLSSSSAFSSTSQTVSSIPATAVLLLVAYKLTVHNAVSFPKQQCADKLRHLGISGNLLILQKESSYKLATRYNTEISCTYPLQGHMSSAAKISDCSGPRNTKLWFNPGQNNWVTRQVSALKHWDIYTSSTADLSGSLGNSCTEQKAEDCSFVVTKSYPRMSSIYWPFEPESEYLHVCNVCSKICYGGEVGWVLLVRGCVIMSWFLSDTGLLSTNTMRCYDFTVQLTILDTIILVVDRPT